MIANRYCQLMCEPEAVFQIDDQGRFFSNHYEAVAEQYLCTPGNDNKKFKEASIPLISTKMIVVVSVILTAIGGIVMMSL